jgi:hypothetical protein
MHNNPHFLRGIRKRRVPINEQLARFDTLPREIKEILWDAFDGKLMARGITPERLREQLAELQRKSTREVYGPDHPQAERDRAEELLANLGLL